MFREDTKFEGSILERMKFDSLFFDARRASIFSRLSVATKCQRANPFGYSPSRCAGLMYSAHTRDSVTAHKPNFRRAKAKSVATPPNVAPHVARIIAHDPVPCDAVYKGEAGRPYRRVLPSA